MPFPPRPAVLAAVAAALASAACGGEAVSYRRAEGEVRRYLRTVEVEGANPGGSSGRIVQEYTTLETAVEVIPRERITTRLEFERVRIEITRPGDRGVLRMDSAEDPPKGGPAEGRTREAETFLRMVAPLRRLVGASVEVTQRLTGKVERIEGHEELRRKVVEGLPEKDPVREIAERMPWAYWITTLTSPAVGAPDRTMSVGETGQFQDIRILPETVRVPGFLYYRGGYRLAGVEDGVARLEMTGEVSLDPSPGLPPWPSAFAPGRDRLRLERGSCRAWSRIRTADGCLEEDEHATDLDLFFVKPDGSGEVPIPTKVTQRTKLLR